MKESATDRMRRLARGEGISEIQNSDKRITESSANVSMIEAHRPHGEKGDFLKVTATLSPEVYKLISDEMQRRKLARLPNAQLSAILREAVVAYLGNTHDKRPHSV
jgi:hypothetical protein